ncbi:MAG: hypothetical protein DWQ34_09075 [Planctomycetota bacterium]|mgnify:FL=1|nr:MAG: hypothetical protein DWQ34_09075 [Planctomycetota bacterium]REK20200.1 MAG: hypothetical protein DWQ41_26015 [Planctomycetota bacterium]REK35347.1 MAG: hypothetical protein DWQ45_11510 [Planctomycetota bacterium]
MHLSIGLHRFAVLAPTIALLAGVLLSPGCGFAVADDDAPESRYLRGLRERRLFTIAETYCLDRLSSEDLLPYERAELTVELSRTFVAHAMQRAGQEQSELWARAQSVVDEQLESDPDNPRVDLVKLQTLLVPAARGGMLRRQSELFPFNEQLRSSALELLQQAAARLRDFETALHDDGQRRRPPTARQIADGAFTAAERENLVEEAEFRTAVAHLEIARLLPAGVERTAALHEAETRFQNLARPGHGADRMWTSRLLRIVVARLQSDFDQARLLADGLLSSDPPGSIRTGATAEQVRIDIDRGRPDEALTRLLDASRQPEGLSGELRALHVEAMLAARKTAVEKGDDDLAAGLWEEAERICAGTDGVWGARCRILLETARQLDRYGPKIAPAVLAGRAAYQNGDLTSAIAHYSAAIDALAAEDGDSLRAELLLNRASMFLEQADYESASDDYAAAARFADAPGAAQAHLMHVFCLGKLWEARPTQARREAYSSGLEEHRGRFAEQPTFDNATWMLAAFEEARQQWTVALSLYASIPVEHAYRREARARTAALYERILQRLAELGQPADEWEDQAVRELTEMLDELPLPPRPLEPSDAQLCLSLARILLNHRNPDYADADALLDRVLASSRAVRIPTGDRSPPDLPEWERIEHTALQLRILSLAGQQRLRDAQEIVDGLTVDDAHVLLSVLNGLADVAESVGPERKRAMGRLQLNAAQRLDEHRDQLDAAEQRLLDDCLAQAYAALDRPNDALAVYERLLDASPGDRSLLRAAAELSGGMDGPEQLQTAKSYWRRLEASEKPGSGPWLDARWHVAETALRLGELEECRKLLQVTRLLYPDLGGPATAERYADLENRLSAAEE